MGAPGDPLLSLGQPALRVEEVLPQEADRSGPAPERACPCEGTVTAPLRTQCAASASCRSPATAAVCSAPAAAQQA